ncbi:MAG: hypothetical protein KDA61_16935 [Planctomycetales bacterium]|nr:hypothetical protein [Planctomycetales bacterium]
MNVTYACPACHSVECQDFDETTSELQCGRCGQSVASSPGSVQGDRIVKCLACPSEDLFVRKDFPQKLGVGLVVVGIIGSSIAWFYADIYWWYGILFATALIDVLLYALVGNVLMCYRCGAHYRGVAGMDAHGQFDLETHEKHRQMEARLKKSST